MSSPAHKGTTSAIELAANGNSSHWDEKSRPPAGGRGSPANKAAAAASTPSAVLTSEPSGSTLGRTPTGTQRVDSGADAEPSRTIKPILARAAVKRSLFQKIAKGFGIHLEGDVATNEISTAKYTFITFLPVNLFEQFLRVANLYFLLTAILQVIPGLSPTSWLTTVAPLVFVLAVNAVKEGYDDVNRHKNDQQINFREVIHLTEDGEKPVFWRDVVAGDILKIQDGEEVPADMVLLSSPDEEDLCYVETANLDGETNLKIKYAWPGFRKSNTPEDFQHFVEDYVIACEAPNARLYVFDGYVMKLSDKSKQPLDANNLLLRGSTLRKTPWAIGVAVNVGNEAKIMQNMTKVPRKVTQLERHMNVLVLVQFGVLLALSAIMAGLDNWWQSEHPAREQFWYLLSIDKYPELPPGVFNFFIMFLRFIILFSNLIPISLYVTLEVVKVFQCALLFNQDRHMYHKDTDTPFVCRTTALNEELGQVQYVLSDKTGTLTQNIMGFVWASVGGVLYGKNTSEDCYRWPDTPADTPHSIALDQDLVKALGFHAEKLPKPDLEKFFVNLAVCNTVVPSTDEKGNVKYQASSPDEEALVQGAAYLGFKLLSRTPDEVVIQVAGEPKPRVYNVLAVLEFNSDRKRMSIITKSQRDGRVVLMCKGADSVILARATPGQAVQGAIEEHLEDMSKRGLRTLVIGERVLASAEYEAWSASFQQAQVALEDREGKIEVASDYIEQQLELVGATAVEDKLQDGVPACLQDLSQAGIKVWVLTGDKVETAISIAYSCNLFNDDMEVLEFREADFISAREAGWDMLRVIQSKHHELDKMNTRLDMRDGYTNVGMVIEGGALAICLKPKLQDAFMALCKACRAVVCCRVSPMQKAQVVMMVKKKAGAITLGIGDGANDVGMIRAAHIGVGISGREGRAAVLSSDFSFAQFRYLSRLLILHGRWSYMRNQEVVLYSFYKNWAYVLVYVYLQCVAGYSAQPIFSTMLISTFNMIFTACPIVAYAVLEQDVDAKSVMSMPQVYSTTRCQTRKKFFGQFALYMLLGAWHSLPVYFLSWYTLTSPGMNGLAQDISAVGTAVWMALVIVVTLRLCVVTRFWNWITHLCYWLSVALMFPFIYVLGILWPSTGLAGVADMTGVGLSLFKNPLFWLASMLLSPTMALLPDLAIIAFTRLMKPTIEVLLQEYDYKERLRREPHHKAEMGQNPMTQPTVHVTGGDRRSSSPSGGADWGSSSNIRRRSSSSLRHQQQYQMPTITG